METKKITGKRQLRPGSSWLQPLPPLSNLPFVIIVVVIIRKQIHLRTCAHTQTHTHTHTHTTRGSGEPSMYFRSHSSKARWKGVAVISFFLAAAGGSWARPLRHRGPEGETQGMEREMRRRLIVSSTGPATGSPRLGQADQSRGHPSPSWLWPPLRPRFSTFFPARHPHPLESSWSPIPPVTLYRSACFR